MKEIIRTADIIKYARSCEERAKERKKEGHWATGYALEQEARKMVDILAVFALDTEDPGQEYEQLEKEIFGENDPEEGEHDGR